LRDLAEYTPNKIHFYIFWREKIFSKFLEILEILMKSEYFDIKSTSYSVSL
jgi:hypothetical protein